LRYAEKRNALFSVLRLLSNLLPHFFRALKRIFVLLQDYEVLELLGKGAFANVYRGRSKLTGLEVAIKMV
jgi:serine/threonine protein kinase